MVTGAVTRSMHLACRLLSSLAQYWIGRFIHMDTLLNLASGLVAIWLAIQIAIGRVKNN